MTKQKFLDAILDDMAELVARLILLPLEAAVFVLIVTAANAAFGTNGAMWAAILYFVMWLKGEGE